jgi:tRNA modification GTPase
MLVNLLTVHVGGKQLQLPLLAKETFQAVVQTSALTRDGLPDLDAALLKLAGAPQLAAGGVSWSVNERQAEALIRAHEALGAVGESIQADMPLDCWTVDLRAALLALGEVSGEGVGEEVLDAVFSKFCIGK